MNQKQPFFPYWEIHKCVKVDMLRYPSPTLVNIDYVSQILNKRLLNKLSTMIFIFWYKYYNPSFH